MSTQTQQAKEEIRENILTLFEIDKLPKDERQDIVNKIGGIIFQLVLVRVLPLMSEEDIAEYEKLTEKEIGPDELMDFFFDRVPNFLYIITEETENFRRDSEDLFSKTIKK